VISAHAPRIGQRNDDSPGGEVAGGSSLVTPDREGKSIDVDSITANVGANLWSPSFENCS
jgi:hypothetical protein